MFKIQLQYIKIIERSMNEFIWTLMLEVYSVYNN